VVGLAIPSACNEGYERSEKMFDFNAKIHNLIFKAFTYIVSLVEKNTIVMEKGELIEWLAKINQAANRVNATGDDIIACFNNDVIMTINLREMPNEMYAIKISLKNLTPQI